MNSNQAYLDAVGVPRWVPRQLDSDADEAVEVTTPEKVASAESIVAKDTASGVTVDKDIGLGIKALVNNPDAKFAILVPQNADKAELQKAWKQLKFAWKQWQNEDIPASLFQLNADSDYALKNLESQQLIIIDTSNLSKQTQKIEAPAILTDKKAWWQLLQLAHEKSQLL